MVKVAELDVVPTWTSDSSCLYHGDSFNFHLGLSHGSVCLFSPSDFSLVRGMVTTLVGSNGAGKTSLAKVISSGLLPGFPNELAVQYVSSHERSEFSEIEHYSSTETPCSYIECAMNDRLSDIYAEIQGLEDSLGYDETDIERIEGISARLAVLYDLQDELHISHQKELTSILDDLCFEQYYDKPVHQLSSGWRYKTRLAAAFCSHPDLLIIDEPSFLDAASTEWLIEKIKHRATALNSMVLLISHKEDLLKRFNDRIWFINSANHSLVSMNCGYETFCSAYLSDISHAENTISKYEHDLESSTASLKSISNDLHRHERNMKKTTSKNADQRFIKGKSKESKQKADRSAASRLKKLKQDELHIAEIKSTIQRSRVKPLKITGVQGRGTLISFDNLDFAYGDGSVVLSDVSARIEAKDRVLLCGMNGSGKSTLMRILLGELEPSSGSIVRQARILYFPQAALSRLALFHGSESCMSYLGGNLTNLQARQHLGNFGLGSEIVFQPIFSLSAGQRVRLWIAKQLSETTCPTLFVMDEISENLDLETRETLLAALNTFEGAVLIVSHDKNFSDSFHPSQIWILAEQKLRSSYLSTS